jgi:hypothetical protein
LPPSSGYKWMPYGANEGIQRREFRHQDCKGANRSQWSLEELIRKGVQKGGGNSDSITRKNAGEKGENKE